MRQQARWRHEWVPRNMAAALLKAHGSREQARRLLDAARERRLERARARRERGDVDWHPLHRAQRRRPAPKPAAGWAEFSDDQLAAALGQADDAVAGRILAELERRDRAQAKRERAAERRRATRDAAERKRDADYDAALEAGEDAAAAYARIWGKDTERVRRAEATDALRRAGYSGKSFAALARNAHAEHAALAWAQAEDATNGYLLNKAGERAGINPRSLFTGPESRARKYASEELLRHWQEVGRLTSDDVVAGLLGGHMRSKGTAAWA